MTPQGSGAVSPSQYLDQLHDEMANNLLQIHTGIMGIMNAAKKHDEGVVVTDDVENFGMILGSAARFSEEALKKYAAVASGDLEPPPGSYAKRLEIELGTLRTRLEGMRGDAEVVGRFTEPGAVIQLGTHDWVNFSEATERLSAAVLALLGKGE